MASKKKTETLSAEMTGLLSQAVGAFHSGQPMFSTTEQLKPLIGWPDGALVEFNKDMKGPNDTIAFRASQKGLDYHAKAPATANPATVTQSAPATDKPADPEFIIEDGVVIPPLKRGGRGGTARRYPFETMNVGQSFHIARTDANPKPSKRIAAVVSGASKNFAPKKFKVQAVDATDNRGEGARVWRTA